MSVINIKQRVIDEYYNTALEDLPTTIERHKNIMLSLQEYGEYLQRVSTFRSKTDPLENAFSSDTKYIVQMAIRALYRQLTRQSEIYGTSSAYPSLFNADKDERLRLVREKQDQILDFVGERIEQGKLFLPTENARTEDGILLLPRNNDKLLDDIALYSTLYQIKRDKFDEALDDILVITPKSK